MRKVLIIICALILSGCSFTNKKVIEGSPSIEEEKEELIEEYQDDNPIKLGIFLYDGSYSSKEVLKDTYYADFNSMKDIGSFEVFFTDDSIVSGTSFKDVWNKYYNMYDNIDNYKVGYNIKFILDDGTNYSSNFLEPDIYRYGDYFYVYLYDDINQKDGAFYSHLEEINDTNIITSIKIFATSGIDRVESIILSAFTYDSDDDFDEEGNYRGNSLYVIRIKRK